MVKPLVFKGDKKPKKRKRTDDSRDGDPSTKNSRQEDASAPGAEGVENDDSWVSAEAVADVSGPVMIVLPTSPHQPWPVMPTARFLSCDKHGVLSATTEAVSPLESFILVVTESAEFQIQTLAGKLLSANPPPASKPNAQAELRGDAETDAPNTTMRIRMQARFKPRIKELKAGKAKEKISRQELEAAVGRRLEEDEVKRLKRARREGDYHEQLLVLKVKGKHDKYS
ncbi:unnamed protein product [Parascedosporium putredinis]|uniref:Actin-crosslinking protein n=1 Tax=Parascedosporium putredinis TaxID=1442378 RepID=A0A9P1MEW0_9PEZI|nr:unnamed protein product [Parascedosporium putredinis]CAI8002234.1 unnamed protein product [Parascedosporium putredinis]